MSNSLKNRITFLGGNSNGRIKRNKLWSFHRALDNDYNSRWMKTPQKRAFKCLINNDNLKMDYDKKIVSVDYNSELETGDVFQLIDDNTYWMILLPDLTETAYLKAQIIRCRYQVEINGKNYWVYFQGPTETDIRWFQKRSINLNEMNLSGRLYIKKDDNTTNYFHRFTQIEIDNLTWEIETVDSISTPGVIELVLKEYYQNQYADLPSIPIAEDEIIMGQVDVKQDSHISYLINEKYYDETGEWKVIGNDEITISQILQDGRICTLSISPYAIGDCTLKYITENNEYEINIQVISPVEYIWGPDDVYPYDIVNYTSIIEGDFSVDDEKKAKIIESSRTSCKIEILSSKKSSFTLGLTTDDETYTKIVKINSL